MTLVRAIVPSALLFAMAAQAAAQAPDATDEGKYRVGESMSFSPAVVVVFAADSNLVRTGDGVGGQEYYVVPQVEAWLGRGYTRLNFIGALEYGQMSVDSTGQKNWGATVNHFTQVAGSAGSRRASVYGLFAHRDHFAPPTDFAGFELSLRSRRIEQTLEAGVRAAPAGRLQFNAMFRRAALRYDSDALYEGVSLEQDLNRNGIFIQGGIDYALTPLSSLTVMAYRNYERFLHAPDRDGNGYNILGGGRFQPQALIGGRLLVGYLKYETLLTKANYDGPSYDVGLTLSKTQGILDVSASRVIDFSFDPSTGFYVTSGIDVFGLLRVGRWYDLFGSAALQHLQPQGPISLVEPFRGIQYVRLGFARRFGPVTQIGIEAETYETGGPGGFSARRVLAFLTYGSTRLQRLDRPRPGSF